MFEDKEEVKQAMMELNMFGRLGDLDGSREEILESSDDAANQIQV